MGRIEKIKNKLKKIGRSKRILIVIVYLIILQSVQRTIKYFKPEPIQAPPCTKYHPIVTTSIGDIPILRRDLVIAGFFITLISTYTIGDIYFDYPKTIFIIMVEIIIFSIITIANTSKIKK